MSEIVQTENEYIGKNGLMHCAVCHEPTEAFIPGGMKLFGMTKRHRQCACERKEYERQEKEHRERQHKQEVERLRSACFTDKSMWEWTFANDNGKNPQMEIAHRYVDRWPEMKKNNQGLLLWGGVGTGKSFFAGCIANALIEDEIPVRMTNFAEILNDLMGSFEGRSEYIRHLTNRYCLLIIDDLGMERGTEYGLEQVYNVIDSRWRAGTPLIVTTNLPLSQIEHPPDLPRQRIYDRLLSMCVPVKIHGESMRAEQAKKNMDSFRQMMQ